MLNGGLSASVALIGYFVLGNLFNLTTSLQLSELSRPSHPLLRQLLLKAPGTYHHTIVVSNLAERAAAAIGVDALLARVGAYYHDIGKTVRPYFFTENIADGSSPHDKLDPMTSAQIIISHARYPSPRHENRDSILAQARRTRELQRGPGLHTRT